MLNRIISFSIHNKLIIGLLVLGLVGYGTYQTKLLPIDAVPDITDNQVQVITVAPAFGALDIERQVTFPIEHICSNIAGIKEIRSFSRFGLSLVTIVFNDDIDVYWARQQVSERLLQIASQIPEGIGTPELGPISSGLGEIYQYVVKPKAGFEKKYDALELRTIQDWIIRRQLLGIKGVAEVSSFGGKLKQIEVKIDLNKLNANNLTLADVFNALKSNNQNTGGAYIEKGPTVLYIRTEGLIKSMGEIENISIPQTANNRAVFIKDIAEVAIGHATRYGAMCFNDQGEVAGAIVMMLKGANSSEVIKNVKERIALIQKSLPRGVEIEPFLDRTKMVNNAIGTVEKNLLEGALIVVFILVLFLGNLRAGLLVASVIPLAMLFAIIMMNLFGVSGNLMSLGALDFGLIVDGAVIIVESTMHQINKAKNKPHLDELVETSSKKMMNAAVFGQLIILIVYLPIFTLEGIEGKMFKPMAQTVAFALLGAFILSLTYIPMMSTLVLKQESKLNFSDRILLNVERAFEKLLIKAFKFPKLIMGGILTLFLSSIYVLSQLGGEFIPALEEGDFAVDTRVLTGSNLNTTIEYTQKAAGLLKRQFPEVEKIVTKIGSGEVPTDPMPMEASDMMVILKDKSEWTSAKTFDALAEKMSIALKDIPGITAGFQFPVQMRFNELMTGSRQDVVCKIFGENLDTLSNINQQLGRIVSGIEGAENLYLEQVNGMPQIEINYNRPAIAQYGLSIFDLNTAVNTALAGQYTGSLYEDEKKFDIVLKLNDNQKKSIEDIKNMLISTPNGIQMPLHIFADISIKNGINQIQREEAKRRITLGFNVNGRDVEGIVTELKTKAEKLRLPSGYFITYGGSFENLVKAKNRLLVAVPISLILILIMLYFAFKNLKQALLIYIAIPLSAIGGILFLAVRDMPFSISAGVGFIALFGVSVLNGIVLITEFNQLLKNGLDIKTAVIEGTKSRLRPVLMTSFVAALGFLPMAISNGAGAEVQRPLATVVIGGLFVAMILTLIALPILFLFTENRRFLKIKTTLILVVFVSMTGHAQESITLNEAYQFAIQNNGMISQKKLEKIRADARINTANEKPRTTVGTEFGQFNSYLFDTKIGFTHTLINPKINRIQKEIYSAASVSATLQEQLVAYELKKAISSIFINYEGLIQKNQKLHRAIVLFDSYLEKIDLQIAQGEKQQFEKNKILSLKHNTTFKSLELKKNIAMLSADFQFLTGTLAVPKISDTLSILKIDTVQLSPEYALLKEINQKNIYLTNLEKEKKKPDISFGLYNMSINGPGSNNSINTFKNRFSSAQFSVNFDLNKQAAAAKIQTAKIEEMIGQNEVAYTLKTLNYRKAQLLKNYTLQLETIESVLKNQKKSTLSQVFIAENQYLSGTISIQEYLDIKNQELIEELNYIDAYVSINQTVKDINFLTSK